MLEFSDNSWIRWAFPQLPCKGSGKDGCIWCPAPVFVLIVVFCRIVSEQKLLGGVRHVETRIMTALLCCRWTRIKNYGGNFGSRCFMHHSRFLCIQNSLVSFFFLKTLWGQKCKNSHDSKGKGISNIYCRYGMMYIRRRSLTRRFFSSFYSAETEAE